MAKTFDVEISPLDNAIDYANLGAIQHMIYDGHNGGTVEVLDNVLVIRRKGVTSLLTQGLKGEKRIPFSSITSVQFREPGLTTGYIQFGVVGGIESRGGVFNATTDENTVLFLKKALNEFRQLRDIVESRIGHVASARTPAQSTIDFAKELTRLADLRDRGVLTEEEFSEEKGRLQSQRNLQATRSSGRSDIPTATAKAANRDAAVEVAETPKSSAGKKWGMGCLILLAILIGLAVLGAIIGPKKEGSAGEAGNAAAEHKADRGDSSRSVTDVTVGAVLSSLTAAQENAVRSAQQYLSMTGFSRKGLIQQLSSAAGDGYSVADATAAVDSLNVDWNENAAKSAKQYLDMTGFSCKGLIQQLSSSAGDKYTVAQATYGARKAGAC